MKYNMYGMRRSYHTLNGMFVREASLHGKDRLRLVLSPSDVETRSFLRHCHRLADDDSVVVDVPLQLLERLVSLDEFGSRDHKLATLPGNHVNLKVVPARDGFEVVDAEPDMSYILAGSEKTGFRPTARFNRLFRQSVRDTARQFAFNHIRGLFDENTLLPPVESGRPLKSYQRDLLRIIAPYSACLCDSPAKSQSLGHASFSGDYLTVEQRADSFATVLKAELDFAAAPPNAATHGKVALADLLGVTAESGWLSATSEKLDETLGQSQRLNYVVSALDDYVQHKLPLRIAAQMERRLGQPLSEDQKREVHQLFGAFMAQIQEESDARLSPVDDFRCAVGVQLTEVPRAGLAVLNHLARDQTWAETQRPRARLSDGTEVDFTQELGRLLADPRSLGIELPVNNGTAIQQAAQAAWLNYVSRDLLTAYWGISEPVPSLASIQALQAETEQRVTDRFTKSTHPLANPKDLFEKFSLARGMLVASLSDYLGTAGGPDLPAGLALAPKSLVPRLMERSDGSPEVTRSRGQLLRSACAVFRGSELSDEAADALAKEASLLTGRNSEDYAREAKFLAETCAMSRTEATAVLLLHEAIDTRNERLAIKLDEFGRQHVPQFQQKVEAALDSRIRPQTLTVSALARMVSESPADVVKALNPEAKARGETANSKSVAVATAAMKALHRTLQRSMDFFKTSLATSIEFKNIDSYVYSGPQSTKMVSEIVEREMHDCLADYFRLASVPDRSRREQLMNAQAASLAERADQSREAVEIEADARCYPAGRSPRRVARDLLAEALNKALLSRGAVELDPYVFSAPSLA